MSTFPGIALDHEQEPESKRASLRFSQALAAYEEADIKNGGNADARSVVKLVVQFIDKMGDPLLAEFDTKAAAQLDAMLPDIPDRKNIPCKQTVSLAARYDYAQEHGWENLKRLTESAEERLSQCPVAFLRMADRPEALCVGKA